MREKTYYKIYLTVLETKEKILLATIRSKGNTYTCLQALKNTYPIEKFTLTVE